MMGLGLVQLLLLGKILARPKRWNSKTIADFAAFAPTERGKIFPNLSQRMSRGAFATAGWQRTLSDHEAVAA